MTNSLSLSLFLSHSAYYILDWRGGLQNGEVTSKVGKYKLHFTKGNLMRYECTCISELKRNTCTQNLKTCILNIPVHAHVELLILHLDFFLFLSHQNKPKLDPEALDLELFGLWQTEVYIPPPAVDVCVYKSMISIIANPFMCHNSDKSWHISSGINFNRIVWIVLP